MSSEPGSPFVEKVYELARAIPSGRVTTYGALARALGQPARSREVGWALGALREGHTVPAHRVVNADGVLSGGWAFGSPEVQRSLLEAEGIRFDERGNVPLEAFLWLPTVPARQIQFMPANRETAEEQLRHVERLLEVADVAYTVAQQLHDEITEMRFASQSAEMTPVDYSLGICLGDAEISANRLGGLRNELGELRKVLQHALEQFSPEARSASKRP